MSLRGATRGLTCTVCDYIGDVVTFYSSTLGCDVAIRWKATLLARALPRDPHVTIKTVVPRDDMFFISDISTLHCGSLFSNSGVLNSNSFFRSVSRTCGLINCVKGCGGKGNCTE